MTKHPSRKVVNFRHLLGCDTIDINNYRTVSNEKYIQLVLKFG